MCAPRPEDHRLVECPHCEGAGEVQIDTWPGTYWQPPEAVFGPCPECNGTGSVDEVVPLIDEEDIDEWIGETV